MNAFLLNIILSLVWGALTDAYNPTNLFGGFIIGYIIIGIASNNEAHYTRKTGQIARFLVFFLWELLRANLRVALVVIRPRLHVQPGIIKIPLDIQSDLGITLLANVITLTPGTLSLDITPDKSALYVHTMYVDNPDTFRQEIKKGFERRIQELLE